MKIRLLSFVLFFLISSPTFAQLVVDESYVTGQVGQTLSTTEYIATTFTGLDAVAAASGENQTWDMTTATYAAEIPFEQTLINFPVADIPGSDVPEFQNATFVRIVESDTLNGYFYQNLVDGALSVSGHVLIGDADGDGADDSLTTRFSPPTVDAVFPIQYESTWRDSTSAIIEGVLVATYSITTTVVDGWGTLITPEGTGPALRIMDTFQTFIIGVPTPIRTSVSFDIVTLDGISASIELDPAGNVVGAMHSVVGESMSTAIEPEGTGIPDSYALSQNFPNPFNPSTRISYSIPEASHVRLTVYTIAGEVVATLANESQPAGSYGVSFDASDLASGMYLYRLQTDHFTETRLMSLIK